VEPFNGPTSAPGDREPYFDEAGGLLDRRVFYSSRVYEAEIRGVFHRAWLCLGPADWVTEPGDWLATRMGPDPVLLWRGQDGALGAHLNRCPASIQPLCPPGRGAAPSIVCACHGWSFASDGSNQAGGPSLFKIPRLNVHKGLIFASRAQTGPTLQAQIGDFGWYLDMVLDRGAGGLEAIGGDALRTVIKADWKLGVSHFCGDLYADQTAHAATNAVLGHEPPRQGAGFQVAAGGGAMAVLEGASTMTPLRGAVFPNLTFDVASGAFQVWHPIRPGQTEVHTYCLVDRLAPTAIKAAAQRALQLEYGPGGLRAQDLERPWLAITNGARRGREMPLNLQMGLNADQARNLPGRIGPLHNELGQRGFFAWWQRQILDAPEQAAPDLLRLSPSKGGLQ
jgi:ethylbenzene dioxygenase alpha subunit